MKVPSLIVAGDGTQVAMVEEGQVTVIDVQTMRARAEVGLAATAADSDVALAGVPAKLVVISRTPGETRLFVVDPGGPEKLGEAATRPQMRLGAIAQDMVLLIGATTALVDLRNIDRPPSTLPVRGAVIAAGSMGDTRMVLAMAGSLEEWDASTRAPVRRLRLERQLDVHLIGGSERRIWMVLKGAPTRIEVIHAQTKSTRVIEVPEPIERLHAHPFFDVLIAVCANASYLVRTDRDQLARIGSSAMYDCVWAGTQIVGWPVDGYPQLMSSPIDLGEAEEAASEDDEDSEPAVRTPAVPAEARAEAESQNLRTALAAPTFSERLASWKSKLEESRGAPLPTTPALPAMTDTTADATAQILERRSAGGWRGEIATWARAITGRSHRPMPFLDAAIIEQLMARLAIPPELAPAIVLLYGAHLVGGDGVARYDLASVIEWRWNALASGPLLASGIVREKDSRFALRREARCALDEAPPHRGTLIGADDLRAVALVAATPSANATWGAALVAPPSVDAEAIAAWGAKLASAPLFVANARGHAKLDRFVLEARIRGAVPVVPDDATATAHGLSIAARWSGLGVA